MAPIALAIGVDEVDRRSLLDTHPTCPHDCDERDSTTSNGVAAPRGRRSRWEVIDGDDLFALSACGCIGRNLATSNGYAAPKESFGAAHVAFDYSFAAPLFSVNPARPRIAAQTAGTIPIIANAAVEAIAIAISKGLGLAGEVAKRRNNE